MTNQTSQTVKESIIATTGDTGHVIVQLSGTCSTRELTHGGGDSGVLTYTVTD